ncbi:CatB-related O-acetyltransferase [Aeromicrobium sp. Leaf350]|uniref:CatB-related O-acetyltransferase n=1 Tax=Aeromicrobium sp. Leaf350 TaxID=2876565 RepID=UPI002714C8B6|nr:CatB-related O-acetyltransferase [Aeromicrobium sp. Leaf350]
MVRNWLRRALLLLRDFPFGRDEMTMRRLVRSGRVVLGQHSYGIPTIHTFIHDESRLIVGAYSSLGGNYLLGGQHNPYHLTTYPLRILWGMEGAGQDGVPMVLGDIVVGSDVWTGYGCWIRSGLTIGDGAIIATGAVVTKDVPPYAIVGGNPARVIKYRHSEEHIAELLDIRWWDWPDDEIRAAAPYIASEDIDAFIAYARDRQAGGHVPS